MWFLACICASIAGYLLGNINGAIVISKLLHHEDIRSKGSGNAGLTNFFRIYGGVQTLLVILIDGAKTVAACYLSMFIFRWFGYAELWQTAKMLGGFASVLGHVFPVLWSMRGGKGILCSGVLAIVMCPWTFVVVFSIFVVFFAITHYVSLGSIVAAASFPITFALFFWGQWYIIALAVGIGILTIAMHHKNIVRLRNGTESKVYLRKQ